MADTPAEIAADLRDTTEAMANLCSVDMGLWDRHARAALVAADTIDHQAAEITALSKENDALRALAASRGCVYGHQSADGACSLGYPGCACMDDLVATMAWSPEDEGRAATKRLMARAEKAEAEITALRSIIGDTVWCHACGSVVPLDDPTCDCMDEDQQCLRVYDRETLEAARSKVVECGELKAEITALRAEIEALRAELSAATGYMLNAKIDLETGAPKRTAIATIEGGLRRARAAVLPSPPAEG